MDDEPDDKIQVLSVIPRCHSCARHTHYIMKNVKSGEAKYFCKLCGDIQYLNYMNSDWEIIQLA